MNKIAVKIASFMVTDGEFPDSMITDLAFKELRSRVGLQEWLTENNIIAELHSQIDYNLYGIHYAIVAKMSEPTAIDYRLKWG